MRPHLASVAVAGAAVLVAGCGGHDVSRELATVPVQTAAAPPPVVVAVPAPATTAAKPAAAAPKPARASRPIVRPHPAPRPAPRAVAPHRTARPSDTAAAAPPPARPPRTPASSAPITASDDSGSEAQRAARVIVVRFHDLLNAHDGAACDLLSVHFLAAHFAGDGADAQRANCQAAVESLQTPVSVLVEGSGTESTGVWVRVVSHFGDQDEPRVMHLVVFGRAWLIDSVEAVPAG